MPETCIIKNGSWNNVEEFVSTLSTRSKKHFRKEILPFEKAFDIVIKEQLTADEITQGFNLYKNVKNNNYAVNTFTYSIDVFKKNG
jgi:predicted N-acyltransferase